MPCNLDDLDYYETCPRGYPAGVREFRERQFVTVAEMDRTAAECNMDVTEMSSDVMEILLYQNLYRSLLRHHLFVCCVTSSLVKFQAWQCISVVLEYWNVLWNIAIVTKLNSSLMSLCSIARKSYDISMEITWYNMCLIRVLGFGVGVA